MDRNKEQGQERTEQHYDVFFSYSHQDTQIAMLIKSAIQSLGYSVFYDQDSLEGDSNWRTAIAENIANCSALVFFRTQHSVKSKWCTREVNSADNADKKILPVAFRREQNNLPSSPALQGALLLQQTCFISDSPTIADLKNELRTSLEKAVGKSQGKENSLLLTDLMVTAADNLNARYKDFFECIEARRIESDVLNDRISFCWPFVFGDEQAKLFISLNKFSKRPVCYANCTRKKSCTRYVEKDRKEYSLEAYLDFAVRDKQSRIEELLQKTFCRNGEDSSWCGNWGTKYFFRRPILKEFKDDDVNETNDLTAVLILLQEAVRFFDACFEKQEYFQFAYNIVSLFREKDPVSLIGEGWTLHDEQKSRMKLHFTKNAPSNPDRSELGILCSNAIDFPEALRIKLEEFGPGKTERTKHDIFAWIRISRFNKNKKYKKTVGFGISDSKKPLEKLKDEIKRIMDLPVEELKGKASQLPGEIHKRLNQFILKAPKSLCWNVSQDNTGCHLTVSCWFPGCPEIRFVTALEYHPGKKTFDWDQTITGSLPGAAEDGGMTRLADITGFRRFHRENIEKQEDIFCPAWSEETLRCLNEVHDRVYKKIGSPLNDLARNSRRWKAWNAITVLRLDSGTDWDDNRESAVNPCRNSEECWKYYLSPGMRFCRLLRGRDFPVMFCVRFAQAGAQNAAVGWVADGGFKSLSVREKELFWYYVLSQFPEELKDRFVCRNNAVFLAKEEDRDRDFRERRLEVFETVQDVKSLQDEWLNDKPDHGGLMGRMFAVIEKAVNFFNIANSENQMKKEEKQ